MSGDILRKQLFGDRVSVMITKKSFGSVHPKRDDFRDQLERLKQEVGCDEMLFPTLKFSNAYVWGDEHKIGSIEINSDNQGNPIPGFLRPPFATDAVVSRVYPMGMFNGDCPAGVILTSPDETGKRHLVFMHLGLMTMISKEGRTSLIAVLLRALADHDLKVECFWMGFGAGPCCYGLHDLDDRWGFIRKWQSYDGVVEKGPRVDQPAIALREIATRQLVELGVDQSIIEIDPYCTTCSGGDPEHGIHFSNLMRNGALARNATLAWLNI